MNITIGITTYGRPDLLEKASISLSSCAGIKNCNVRIYDDCSPYWDEDYLRAVFPTAKEIRRRGCNLGADGNMRQMFIDFLETGDDHLVIADSDLIFRPDFINCILDVMPLTDGIFSLYNSVLHPAGKSCAAAGIELVEKQHVGAAGTVMSRAIVAAIVKNVPPSRSYDWDWCRYLRDKGIKILVAKESYVQHIGIHGINSSSFATEYGVDFYPKTADNEKAIVEFFQQVIARKDDIIRSYRLFKPVVYPRRTARNFLSKMRLAAAGMVKKLSHVR